MGRVPAWMRGFVAISMAKRKISWKKRGNTAIFIFERDLYRTNRDSSLCVVGRALLPVDATDGQECPSYAGYGSMKFRLRASKSGATETSPNLDPPPQSLPPIDRAQSFHAVTDCATPL